MRKPVLLVVLALAGGSASGLTFDEALARHEKWKTYPFQLVVDPGRFTNVPADYSYPPYHYMSRLFVIGRDGKEKPAPLAAVDALIAAEIEVMSEAERRCEAAGQYISYDGLNDTAISNGIVFVEGMTAYRRDTDAKNAGIAAKNVALAVPRLLGNLYGGAVYQVDRAVTGYETLKGADHLFPADSFKHPYTVRLGEGTPGWQHVYMAGKDYVAKAYVRDDPAAMRRFIREFFRKGAGCGAYQVGAD